jgi:hypothetical protein
MARKAPSNSPSSAPNAPPSTSKKARLVQRLLTGKLREKALTTFIPMPSASFPPESLAATFPKLRGFGFIKSGTFKSVYRITAPDGASEVPKM